MFFVFLEFLSKKYGNARTVFKLSEYKQDGKDSVYFVRSSKTKKISREIKTSWIWFRNVLQFIYLDLVFKFLFWKLSHAVR